MKAYYEVKDNALVSCPPETATLVVYATPDEAEKQQLLETLHITRHDLESALDPDEISRVEYTPEHTYIIWKRPNNVSYEQQLRFEVSSVGLFLQKDRMTIILGESTIPFDNAEFRKVGSLNSVFLKFFLHTVHHFLGHLKAIKLLTAELQAKLNVSLENRYLLQMFTLGESLIYYLNAIEANASVLTKIRANTDKTGLSKDELEMMDDIMIEHQQCSRQTQIYSSVLSGLMDARGSIINNNMNVLLRNLTIINVVFLPLNLIASIGGMSEFSAITSGISWAVSYPLFMLAMAILAWFTWFIVIKRITAGLKVGKRKKKPFFL